MSADGATVAAARALGGGRGALSDSSVVPLARGVAPSGPSLPSQALCGAAARPRRTKNTLQFNASTVRPRFTRESAVSGLSALRVSVSSLCMGRALERARSLRCRRCAGRVVLDVRHSLDETFGTGHSLLPCLGDLLHAESLNGITRRPHGRPGAQPAGRGFFSEKLRDTPS